MVIAGQDEYRRSPFPIGQPIVIIPEEGGEADGEDEGYPSRIEDVLQGELVVSMPMRRRTLVDLPVNSGVTAYFNRSGARYHFRGIVKASKEYPFPVLHLATQGRVVRQERRAHVRVNAIIEPIRLEVVGEEGIDRGRKLGFVVNLSAGGLGLICRCALSIGSALGLSMDLPMNAGRLEAEAEVVRCRELQRRYPPQWQVGARLKELPPKDRDRVESFVFQQQQVLRRRGLM